MSAEMLTLFMFGGLLVGLFMGHPLAFVLGGVAVLGAQGQLQLTRAVGKAKAMDLILTGRTMNAEEAERAGLVSRIVPAADLETEAMTTVDVNTGAWIESFRPTVDHQVRALAAMPDGLDTLVGARGVRLSGGQIQRVGAARDGAAQLAERPITARKSVV